VDEKTHTKIPEPQPFDSLPVSPEYIAAFIGTIEHLREKANQAASEISDFPYPTDSPLSSAVYNLRQGNLQLALDQLKVAHYEASTEADEDPS